MKMLIRSEDMIRSEAFERAIRALMVELGSEAMKAKVVQIRDMIQKAVR